MDVDLGFGIGQSTKRFASGGMYAWHWDGRALKSGQELSEARRQPEAKAARWPHGSRRRAASHQRSGIKGLSFRAAARYQPWGAGSWGRVPSMAGDVLFADFIGQQHIMRLDEKEGWPKLISTRCADFENVTWCAGRESRNSILPPATTALALQPPWTAVRVDPEYFDYYSDFDAWIMDVCPQDSMRTAIRLEPEENLIEARSGCPGAAE